MRDSDALVIMKTAANLLKVRAHLSPPRLDDPGWSARHMRASGRRLTDIDAAECP